MSDVKIEDLQKQVTDLQAQLEAATAETEKWKAHSRKNEERAKENAEAAKERDALKAELDTIKTSKLTDEERTAKDIADLKATIEAERDARKASDLAALKARVGAEKGLPPALIARLQGEDETSIAADADALLEVAKPGDGVIDIGQGQRGSATGKPSDPVAKMLAGKLGIST